MFGVCCAAFACVWTRRNELCRKARQTEQSTAQAPESSEANSGPCTNAAAPHAITTRTTSSALTHPSTGNMNTDTPRCAVPAPADMPQGGGVPARPVLAEHTPQPLAPAASRLFTPDLGQAAARMQGDAHPSQGAHAEDALYATGLTPAPPSGMADGQASGTLSVSGQAALDRARAALSTPRPHSRPQSSQLLSTPEFWSYAQTLEVRAAHAEQRYESLLERWPECAESAPAIAQHAPSAHASACCPAALAPAQGSTASSAQNTPSQLPKGAIGIGTPHTPSRLRSLCTLGSPYELALAAAMPVRTAPDSDVCSAAEARPTRIPWSPGTDSALTAMGAISGVCVEGEDNDAAASSLGYRI